MHFAAVTQLVMIVVGIVLISTGIYIRPDPLGGGDGAMGDALFVLLVVAIGILLMFIALAWLIIAALLAGL